MSVYDIHLRATTTTTVGIRGVTIHIGLVSSTTDSLRRSAVLFNLYQYEPQTLSLSSCVNQAFVAQNLQTPPAPPRMPGTSPTPSPTRITHTVIVLVLLPSTSRLN